MKRESGYTLIEVGLALAISGSMLFMVASLHNMSVRQRFNDSINGTKTFIERQYNDVRFGINARMGGNKLPEGLEGCSFHGTADTTGNSDCYVVGRLLEFKHDKILVSYIVATPDKSKPEGRAWDNPDGIKLSAAYIIYAAANQGWLKVLPAGSADADAGSRSTQRLYGSENVLEGAWNVVRGSEPTQINKDNVAIAILHNPIGGAVMAYNNIKLEADATGKIARVMKFTDSDDMSKIGSSVDALNNTLGIVLYLKKEGANDSYSVAYCIPTQGTLAGVQSNAPAPFKLDLSLPNDRNNLIGVCDETAKSKR